MNTVRKYRPVFFAFISLVLVLLSSMPAMAIDAQQLFQKAKDSVVVVFSLNEEGNPTRFGSGFLIRRGDKVATNYHVIAGAANIKVKLPNGSVIDARSVLAESPKYDLAIIDIPNLGKGLPLAGGQPAEGEEVIAIGHPKGLERTLSTGIVSGIRMKGDTVVYQITAPISPGSSGGPILNASGEVLGLATFYAQGGQNLNFAIPSNYINKLLGSSYKTARGSKSGGGVSSGSSLGIQKSDGGITIFAK